jgi:cytoskeletal protein RodZ
MAEMDQDPGIGATVGERLRYARETRGLTLEDVAMQTRVPIRHLRAIEDSQFDELPAVTYTVGFGRSYANAVGLDGAEVGRELRLQLGDGVRGPQVSPAVYAPPDPSRVPSRSLAWMAGLLLVVLVAGYLIWRSQLGDGGDATATPAPAPVEQQAQAPEAQQQPQPAPVAAGQQVTLVATGEVWFRISDRQGNRRVEDKTLRPQEQYQVPLSVAQPVIATGRPQLLRVNVAGRDIGPLAPAERRIANVSLLAPDLATALQGGQGAAAPSPTGP